MIPIIFSGFLLFTLVFALWRGGSPEKLAALFYLLASVGSTSTGLFSIPGGFEAVPPAVLLSDLFLLVVLTWLAVRANRLWLIAAASCQLLAVLVHLARLLAPDMVPVSYAALIMGWSWPMVALLLAGTIAHHSRVVQRTPVASWKAFFEPQRIQAPEPQPGHSIKALGR